MNDSIIGKRITNPITYDIFEVIDDNTVYGPEIAFISLGVGNFILPTEAIAMRSYRVRVHPFDTDVPYEALIPATSIERGIKGKSITTTLTPKIYNKPNES